MIIAVICTLHHAILYIQSIFLVIAVFLNEAVSSVPTSKSWFLFKYMWLMNWSYWKAKVKNLEMVQKYKFQLSFRLEFLCHNSWPKCFYSNWKLNEWNVARTTFFSVWRSLVFLYFSTLTFHLKKIAGHLDLSWPKWEKATTNAFILLLV